MKNVLAFTTLLLCALINYAQNQKPNIIYILADDLGYADLGCFGSKHIKTPVLDGLAANGLKLTRHYSTAVCAPSRAALMTGKHMGTCEIRGNKQDVTGYGQHPLSDTAITVAQLLKKAGYATALIGKWGLGEPGTSGDPHKKGFDMYYGYTDQVLAHNHYPEFLIKNGQKIPLANKVQYLDENAWHKGRGSYTTQKTQFSQDLFTLEALAFIEENKNKPFFLYYAPIIPHDNGEAPEGQKIESPTTEPYSAMPWTEDEKRYAASITYLDNEIGKLVTHLKKQNLLENTLIIFVSDNGPDRENVLNSTGGLRGIKRDMYEGGIRVPFIAYWQGKIKPNTVNTSPTTLWDFFPTACELAGVAPTPNNGESFAPLLQGKKWSSQRKHLYFELHDGGIKQAVVMGNWKAVRKNIEKGKPLPPIELYNLKNDPTEKIDVAKQNPVIVEKMEAIMKKEHTYNPLFNF